MKNRYSTKSAVWTVFDLNQLLSETMICSFYSRPLVARLRWRQRNATLGVGPELTSGPLAAHRYREQCWAVEPERQWPMSEAANRRRPCLRLVTLPATDHRVTDPDERLPMTLPCCSKRNCRSRNATVHCRSCGDQSRSGSRFAFRAQVIEHHQLSGPVGAADSWRSRAGDPGRLPGAGAW